MMTEAQIEQAARELCRTRGVDPDAQVSHGAEPDTNGFVPDVLLFSPAWVLAAKEVRAFEQMMSVYQGTALKREGGA